MSRRRLKPTEGTTSRWERALRVFAILAACFALMMVSAYGAVLWFIEAPEVDRAPISRTVTPLMEDIEAPEVLDEAGNWIALPAVPLPDGAGWRPGVYTILLAGEDDGFGGNDVIMVVLFDTIGRTLDVLSIPRDTVVNVPWGLKKINSIQHMHRYLPYNYPHYIYALRDEVANLVGYTTDHWITLDLGGFVTLVDALGGIEIEVPQRMLYSDPCQGLRIDLQPGLQRLNGQQAEGLIRFRNYADGDISRIRMQHAFLEALGDQLLSARGLLAIDDLLRLFRDSVETDLTLRNLAFFASEFMRLEPEHIRFHTVDRSMANIGDSVGGISYVTLFVEPWVEMINQYMNPFTFEIYAEDLEILTRNPQTRQFFTTNGAPWRNNWVR